MLQVIVPVTQIDLLDEITMIVCAIINLNKSIIHKIHIAANKYIYREI